MGHNPTSFFYKEQMNEITVIRQSTKMSRQIVKKTVYLHRESLSGSLLSDFNDLIIQIYYQSFAASEKDHLFLALKDRQVVGAATLSFDSSGVMGRMFRRNMFSARFYGGMLLSIGGIIPFLKGYLCPDSKMEELFSVPEVIQLFVDGNNRGGGIGSLLLEQVEAFLKKRSIRQYFIKTISSANNKALDFYKKNNFVEVDRRPVGGKEFVYMMKSF